MNYRILSLGLLLAAGVASAQEPAECWKQRRFGHDNEAAACFEKLGRSSNPYLRAEALWGLESYSPANDAFRDAVRQQPKNATYRVRWGRLFLERFNSSEADKLFQEALELDPTNAQAFLGLADSFGQSFDPKAVGFAEEAVKNAPNSAIAHATLARLALEDGETARAATEADKALAIESDCLDALAVRAAMDWLADKKENVWEKRDLAVNPRDGALYETGGHFFVLNRRYEEGIAAYRKAVELSPRRFSAHAELGVSLMRLGREDEARRELELCFNNGYASSMVKNTLTLMDSYVKFTTFKTPKTVLRLQTKEAQLLRPYFEAELLRAIDTYEKKYHEKLKGPVQLEVYPDHEDFAVRTMGMPGLGALGVTFGNVVAMDSPSGRTPGSFHWASTMWHELSHVYVLSATNFRVPRWFTEGLAVYEETAVAPDWGDRLDPESIKAIKAKKLLPIAELDKGFVRPSYPSQVIVSYFQAGKICEYIAQTWSYDKLLSMMHRFGDRATTVQVVNEELKLKPEEFDKRFLAWLDAQTSKQVGGYERWSKGMKAIGTARAAKQWDEVILQGTEIRDLYPDYVESGSVYELLAEAYLAKKDDNAARGQLEVYSKEGGRQPAPLKKLAKLQQDAGNLREAAATLERINFVYLEDEEVHHQAGEIALQLKNNDRAIREFQAFVHCNPVDKAGAHYDLARAYNAAGKLNEAKDELVDSLEAAPGFKPAQRLLLEINQRGATD